MCDGFFMFLDIIYPQYTESITHIWFIVFIGKFHIELYDGVRGDVGGVVKEAVVLLSTRVDEFYDVLSVFGVQRQLHVYVPIEFRILHTHRGVRFRELRAL